MSKPLEGRVAVVTGASSGIGEATAKRLAEAGAKVVLGARRMERLEALVKEIEASGGVATFRQADVVSREDLVALVRHAHETYGPVDILVNNAGIMLLSPITALLQDEWDRMVDVNVKGVLNGIGAVLPGMLERGKGDIVNISSDAGRKTFPTGTIYCGTKWAVEAITQGLRAEIAGKGIRVTSIQPGATTTELDSHITHSETKEGSAAFKKAIRFLDADDVARAVVYAVSQPPHASINEILLRPTQQGSGNNAFTQKQGGVMDHRHHIPQPAVGMIVCPPGYSTFATGMSPLDTGLRGGGLMRVETLGGLPYAYPYPYAVPDHRLSVAAAAAAAAGKRSREDGAEICRDYLSGKCSRGKNCKYVHYDPYGVAVQRKPTIEVCLDFQRGTCTRGLECKYLHVQSPQAASTVPGGEGSNMGTKRSTEICKDFNRGLCTRGDACRYLHVTIPTINQQAQGISSPQQQPLTPNGGAALSPAGPGHIAAGEEMTKKPKVEGSDGDSELSRLRLENQSLRAANRQLEEEVAELRAKLRMTPSGSSVGFGYDSLNLNISESAAMDEHQSPL